MGYALLWIEGLAAGLLLVAVATACAARLAGRRWQRAWAAGVLLLVVLPAGALSAVLWWFTATYPLHTWLFVYVITWMVACGLLGAWVIFRGLRLASVDPSSDGSTIQGGSGEPRARGWRRGRFVTWLIIVLVVQTHTIFIIDMRVRSALKTINKKGLELARSLEPTPVPDEQNAAGRYTAAAKSMGDHNAFAEQFGWRKFGWYEDKHFDAKRPGLVKALKMRQAALADVREASKLPAWYETGKLYHGTRVNVVVPSLILLMDLASFLTGDARVKAAAGDVAGALEDLTAIKRIAAHVNQEPSLVCQMIAIAIDAKAAEVIEPVLAAAATPLPPELIPLPVAVRELKRKNWVRTWQYQAAISNSWVAQDISADRIHYNLPWQPFEMLTYIWGRMFLAQREIAALQKQYEQLIAIAGQPYHVSRETRTRMERPDTRRGLLTKFVPNLADAFEAFAQARAAARLYALTLAAAAFHARSGKPLRLKPVPGGLILYSVGNDGKDNGGKRGSDHLYAEDGADIVFQLGAAYKK